MTTSDAHESSGATRRLVAAPASAPIVGTASRELFSPLEVLVPADVAAVIDTIGRTEDIALSPDGTRLLIAGFEANVLALVVFEIDSTNSERPVIELTGVTFVTDPLLAQPHGVDFLTDTTILVANRASEVLIIEVPSPDEGRFGCHNYRSAAKVLLNHESPASVRTPGSLAIRRFGNLAEVVVCNNYVHDVTRHVIDLADSPVAVDHEVLINSGLQIPDGVAVSPSGTWLAISNHLTHEVLIYRYDEHLRADAEPCGRLQRMSYPHGLRFSADERHLLVADAGLPYIHAYAADDRDWTGSRQPARTARLMDDDTFGRGRYNPQEGGPKGLAFVSDDVIVVTSEHQRLGFFSRHDLFSGPMQTVLHDDADRLAITRISHRLSDATDTAALLQVRAVEAETSQAEAVATHNTVVETNQRLRAELAERNARLSHFAATCESLRAELANTTQRHLDQIAELVSANKAHSELTAEAFALLETRRLEAQEVAARATAEAEAIKQSTAWRVTRPARTTLDVVRRLRS